MEETKERRERIEMGMEDKKLVCDSCHIHLKKDVDVMCWNRKNRSSMSWGGEKKTLCNRCYFGDDYKD
tara:strand:+ start:719 stop:922 length:204 start_codon:yes stop_codon:yes gene_type:complete